MAPKALLVGLAGSIFWGRVEAQIATVGFEDSTLGTLGVEVCCGNTAAAATLPVARAGTKALRVRWQAANYQGTRSSRGVEVIHGTRATKEAWLGFSVYVPAVGFPADKNVILGQLIAWHPACNTDKTFVLATDGAGLYVGGYAGLGTIQSEFAGTLTETLPRNRWLDVVVHAVFSRAGQGSLTVWYDGAPLGAPTYSVRNVNFGNGCFTGDALTHGVYPKAGMYCWDVPNYTAGETREAYYDEIRWQAGPAANGYALVRPPGLAPGHPLATSSGVATAPPAAYVRAYPNPTTGQGITVRLGNLARPVSFSVLDATGRALLTQPVNGGTITLTAAQVAQLPPGLYVLQARDAQRTTSQRLVVGP